MRQGIPAPASHAKVGPPNGPRPATDQACCWRFTTPQIHPCPMHTRHAAVDSRRPSHDAPAMPRPCRILVSVAPSSIVSRPAPPPLPCTPIKGLCRAPAHAHPSTTIAPPLAPPLDHAVEPHFPLLFCPNRGSKRVALDLLVLHGFPTLPSLAGLPPPVARTSAELLLTAGSPTLATPAQPSTPTGFPRSPCAPPPLSPHRLLVLSLDFGREQPSPGRVHIALSKIFSGSFLLDPGTYLRESEYFYFQNAVTLLMKIKKMQTKICCNPLDESNYFCTDG
jgi:hypothetical protein